MAPRFVAQYGDLQAADAQRAGGVAARLCHSWPHRSQRQAHASTFTFFELMGESVPLDGYTPQGIQFLSLGLSPPYEGMTMEERREVRLTASASRSEIEAFMATAEARIDELDGVIDAGYRRLSRRGAAEQWRAVEALEVDREETILRVEEAFAMLETMTDDEGINADGGCAPDDGFVFESFRNPRAPLPHGWEWPDGHLARVLTVDERKAQGWPEAREEALCAFAPGIYVFGARVQP